MSIYIAVFLGIVQGLTEFLPVSSSGHLILFQHFFKLPEDMLLFNIVLHIATLCAVCVVFRKTIWGLIRHPWNKTNLCLIIATAVTCALVLIFKDLIDRSFTYKILPFSFLATAILLFLTSFVPRGENPVGKKSALIVGLAQGIAVVPGLSRSGTTISTLLASGVQKNAAAEFSFLMSIPVIVASFLLELLSAGGATKLEILPTSIAFIAAVLSGIFAIKFMLVIIRGVKLHYFAAYLVVLSVVCFVLFYII
jgi:undecaprenyl-diphosphatase